MNSPGWRDGMAKKAIGLLVLGRARRQAGIERARLFTEKLARKTADGTIGQKTTEPEDKELAEMDIRVGDEVVHNHYPAPRSKASTLAKLALVASGVGVGVAIPLIYSALTPPPVEAAPDTDTRYELRLDP